MFVYLITNKINNKVYVGQCQGPINDRWARHKYDARLKRYNSKIGAAICKYGEDAFTIQCLAKTSSKNELDYLESYFIVIYNAQDDDFGYNITNGGDGSYGLKLSPEACAKMGKTKIGNKNCVGRIVHPSTRQKISEANKRHYSNLTLEQRKRSPEFSIKLSLSLTGKKKSPAHIEKMRQNAKKQMERQFLKTVAWG